MNLNAIAAALVPMKNGELRNYIIPGVSSHLIGGPEHGKVRLFTASRSARDFVTPHSHRFDFTCLVLSGRVLNTIYRPGSETGEEWCTSTIGQVCGAGGVMNFVHKRSDAPTLWYQETQEYGPGATYAMKYDEIHSIQFHRGTQVLFFEGPAQIDHSVMLEPWCGGKVVPTFKTEDWMFERD